MTHICVGNLTIIGSDNGLSPERRQAIIWTNAGILLIGPLGTNFNEILIEIQTFTLKKMRLKMSSAKCCSLRLGLNVLSDLISMLTSCKLYPNVALIYFCLLHLFEWIPWNKWQSRPNTVLALIEDQITNSREQPFSKRFLSFLSIRIGHMMTSSMETFSALLALCAGNTTVTGAFPSQRPVTQSFGVFLICAWTNSWVNNQDAGDLRRHRTHHDVIVMDI